MKETFVLYTSMLKSTKKLSLEQKGKLFEAIIEYQMTGEVPEIDDLAVEIYFDMIKNQMDLDNKKYQETLEKRREAGKKGGRPKKANDENDTNEKAKKANGFEKKQMEAKKANGFFEKHNDNVNDNVNVNDNDNVNEDNKKEKKIYARDEILEEALNKSDVQVMLNDLGVDETFLYELFHYRQSIGKPILNVKMLIKTLNDFKQTKLKTGKDVYELFEIMQSEGWKNITASYVMNSEKARKQNKDNEQEWIEEAQAEIEAFVNS